MFRRLKNAYCICSKTFGKRTSNCKTSKIFNETFISDVSVNYRYASSQEFKIKESSKNFEDLKPANKFTKRTHTCGELTSKNIGEKVQLCGWVEFQRFGKFCILRDTYGSTQIMIKETDTKLVSKIEKIPLESVITIKGAVISRPSTQINPKMKTGEIEVVLEEIVSMNLANPTLPFLIRDSNIAKEQLQLKHRYLALRFPEIQKNLKLRSQMIAKMRDYLVNSCEFLDIETPTLFKKTPGGAQEFIVPTRHRGKFYSLVQSPQQFKQLLMVGGLDRYFQFARCYRDEGAKSNRQPEFTQMDLEMSFIDEEDIMALTEKLLQFSWPKSLGSLDTPFQRMKYEDAINLYGTDSPDLRIPYKMQDISHLLEETKIGNTYGVYALVVPNKKQFLTRSTKEQLLKNLNQKFPTSKTVQFIQTRVTEGEWTKDLTKLFAEDTTQKIKKYLRLTTNDVLFIARGPISTARHFLGFIREDFVRILESKGDIVKSNSHQFVWVTDFPLFTMKEDEQILETTHHPFTQPHPEDMSLLYSDPLKVRGLHYDLVLNGNEIGGGSIRIHNRVLQEQIFKLLSIDSSEMYYLLEALDSGAPPHGGIAIGLDRYLSIVLNSQSIRDVMAFPKTMEGRDLMSGAPTNIQESDKSLYYLETVTE